ncbi:hypothetical protein IMZ48_15930, partial [Candidatus Bathyarchaeota archaeon]|nr:hypothetical protein [Candidatus Bathyarchaeota archaeon]
MLSHLRFHRRNSSNPASPVADPQLQSPRDNPPRDGRPSTDARPDSSNSSSLPPTLPPIARVTSGDASFGLPDFSDIMPHKELPPGPPRELVQQQPHNVSREQAQQRGDRQQPPRDPQRGAPVKSPYDEGTGFIGGLALQKYREEAARRQDPSDTPASDTQHAAAAQPVPLSTSSSMTVVNKASSSFVAPTDLRSAVSPTGRIPPPNARPAEPYPYPSGAVVPIEPPKGKKGLPFLKNPMSTLLMRRKASQNAPDILPLPLLNTETDLKWVHRGTKVHDFSAPRPRKPATQAPPRGAPNAQEQTDAKPPPIPYKSSLRRQSVEAAEQLGQPKPRPSRSTDSARTIVAPGATPSTRRNAPPSASSNPLQPSLDKPLPPGSSPPLVPPKDNVPPRDNVLSFPVSRFSSSTTARSSTGSGSRTHAKPSVKSARG